MSDGAQTRRPPQVLRGMRDFTPRQMLLRQRVIDILRRVFERYGFDPIDTPLLEYYEVLSGKYGEEGEKLLYRFVDHGGRAVGLRYDLTVPLARYVAVHRAELTFPFKRYHIGPVFRAERPQRGRYRQFWQCDVDVVGTRSMLADAEVLSVWIDALSALRVPNAVIHVNHRQLLEALARAAGVDPALALSVYRAIDKLAKIGEDGVREELIRAGVEPKAAERVLGLIRVQGHPETVVDTVRHLLAEDAEAQRALDELAELFGYLAAYGTPEGSYILDLSLARGLDYYTGPVAEVIVREPAIGSLGGAGRYDRLIGMFLGEEIPATGASLGLERLVEVVDEFGLLPTPETVSDVLVVAVEEQQRSESLRVAQELRANGIDAEVYLGERVDLRRQLQYANRKGIPFAIIVGPDELTVGVVTLRNLVTGEQERVARHEIVATALQRLVATGRRPARERTGQE
ncbi:histidine--tRNA ligase [Thermomicrobium sp. CFH 73360]|uniref:histidine--tRNA ligase n=1 Tax=Thermomicrobium sp. CFH 73360 TaxID=2951987 RepID=UPI00207678B7|nr:histidine--tRNA ligase [Thermomicrobium sp. CFH 73360]MCM8744929.1 histidine--tRNA ligase [Thermomicrobium sp. CFH 73360]